MANLEPVPEWAVDMFASTRLTTLVPRTKKMKGKKKNYMAQQIVCQNSGSYLPNNCSIASAVKKDGTSNRFKNVTKNFWSLAIPQTKGVEPWF